MAGYEINIITGLKVFQDLNALLSGTEQLRKTFVRLNGDVLKDPARSFNEWTYYGKMRNLADILRNMQPH